MVAGPLCALLVLPTRPAGKTAGRSKHRTGMSTRAQPLVGLGMQGHPRCPTAARSRPGRRLLMPTADAATKAGVSSCLCAGVLTPHQIPTRKINNHMLNNHMLHNHVLRHNHADKPARIKASKVRVTGASSETPKHAACWWTCGPGNSSGCPPRHRSRWDATKFGSQAGEPGDYMSPPRSPNTSSWMV